jgi:hypothetical protein
MHQQASTNSRSSRNRSRSRNSSTYDHLPPLQRCPHSPRVAQAAWSLSGALAAAAAPHKAFRVRAAYSRAVSAHQLSQLQQPPPPLCLAVSWPPSPWAASCWCMPRQRSLKVCFVLCVHMYVCLCVSGVFVGQSLLVHSTTMGPEAEGVRCVMCVCVCVCVLTYLRVCMYSCLCAYK